MEYGTEICPRTNLDPLAFGLSWVLLFLLALFSSSRRLISA